MKITSVNLFTLHGTYPNDGFPPGNRQAKSLDLYTEFNTDPEHRGGDRPISAIYVEIESDAGLSGIFGPIEDPNGFTIAHMLRPYLLGRDPLAGELLHDQMLRLDRHGRSGYFMTGLSAVDIALWDLRGKALDLPVYRLLGGPTRNPIPAYASMLGFSTEPDAAAQEARKRKEEGYRAQKWFFRYGPGDGAEGLARNLAMARAVREATAPDYPLMFDAFWSWDLAYATEMVQKLAPISPRWMEEPVAPERIGSLRKLREIGGVPIATGEHVYTRWQTRELLSAGAVDVLQNDPDWTGGITEQVKICALASSFEVPVIAHGHSLLPALHVAAGQPASVVPYVEYLLRYQPAKQFFHTHQYRPEGGSVLLPDQPGLGLVLDEEKIERREPIFED